ncbi:hypothetical protein [Streptomyces violaceus]|uniref:Uncharacterized protein n=1 Tax=Streptomyces violaceus TaxID=1936 RepID=A0ABY9UM47_STRVL|nr:hypothetical protein [Streptomyces janthinus]WND23404.1 hypothetical protein RI060_41415 [Streptomyces janthinus]
MANVPGEKVADNPEFDVPLCTQNIPASLDIGPVRSGRLGDREHVLERRVQQGRLHAVRRPGRDAADPAARRRLRFRELSDSATSVRWSQLSRGVEEDHV